MTTIPEYVNLCGIRYRVQESEGSIVFTATDGYWGCFNSLSFTAEADGLCWYVRINSNDGMIMVGHLVAAYEIVKKHYGENHEIHWGKEV